MRARPVATAVWTISVVLAAAAPASAQAPGAIPLATSPVKPNPAAPAPKPSRNVKAAPKAAAAPAREPDFAFGAYQRGYYLTAFAEATKRVNANADPRSMTLLGFGAGEIGRAHV